MNSIDTSPEPPEPDSPPGDDWDIPNLPIRTAPLPNDHASAPRRALIDLVNGVNDVTNYVWNTVNHWAQEGMRWIR